MDFINNIVKNSWFLFAWLFLIGFSALQAQTITYTLNSVIAGNIQGTPPTAVLKDVINYNNTNFNAVQLTMNNTLASKQFITQWVFNINPALNGNLASLQFTRTSGTPPSNPTITKSVNGVNLSPVKGFDIGFEFATSKNGGRFDAGQSLTYILSLGGKSIFASDFAFTNGGGPGPRPPYFTAAMIQGGSHGINAKVGAPGVGVPEPTTYLLMGSFLGAALLLRRRRQRA